MTGTNFGVSGTHLVRQYLRSIGPMINMLLTSFLAVGKFGDFAHRDPGGGYAKIIDR